MENPLQAIAHLRDALESLANAPGGVAAEIRRSGIKGERSCSARCPIAIWLTNRLCRPVVVGPDSAAIDWPGQYDSVVPLPIRVQDFVIEFDGARYPDLIDREHPLYLSSLVMQ